MSIHNQPQCYGKNTYQASGIRFITKCPKCKEIISNTDCFDPIKFIQAISKISIDSRTENLQRLLIEADKLYKHEVES